MKPSEFKYRPALETQMAQHTLELRGCTPVPLAGYLKALGILRIVSQQADKTASGWWDRDVFHLRSKLDAVALTDFFLNGYSPTPLVAPWNGGSGFFPKDNKVAIDAISAGTSERFAPYRHLIATCRDVLESLNLVEKPDSDDKPKLLQQCRNLFPDESLEWLDAAFVLTDSGPKYPPLLGTGGNDGRLEFTNNYMQRLTEVFDLETGTPTPQTRVPLADAVFAACGESRGRSAIGQFDPGSAGGANATSGYDDNPTMNVWDFILMLEGAIAFAGTSVRKLEQVQPGTLSYPFCVRPAGIGYGSADLSDESTARSEMWMPLWEQPSTFQAVSHLLSEGRVDIGRRRARTGVDFARAISSVGVDRGIQSFQRYSFQQRNGLSYFAVPLGRFNVRSPSMISSLLAKLDGWLDRFRRAATGQHAPGRASSVLRRLENAIVDACQRPNKQAVQGILIALGQAEAAIAVSPKLREADYPTPPVPLLPAEWLGAAYDDSVEFRLAASLASIGTNRNDAVGAFRRHLEPIEFGRLNGNNRRSTWAKRAGDPSIVWSGGRLVRNMIGVMERRLIDVVRCGTDLHAPFDGRCAARLTDILDFINGDVDDARIESLLRGLMLIDWPAVKPWQDIPWQALVEHAAPSVAYCQLKLCMLPHSIPALNGTSATIKLTPQIARRAAVGDLAAATELAARRLRASGLHPAVESIHGSRDTALRTAAALVFPLQHNDKGGRSAVTMIRDRVLRHESAPENDSHAFAAES
jgi:CRISPR-associated protein Csx17